MNHYIYQKLARVLDTLPYGFPETESGVELKLLKRIFSPEEAALFCDLKFSFENAVQIAERTGHNPEDLEEKLYEMGQKGQIQFIRLEGTLLFRMRPWEIGIYEAQINRMDRELAELNHEYAPEFVQQLFEHGPQLLQTLPIEEEIPSTSEPLPYERVSSILEASQSFLLMECPCKKEHELLGAPCEKPTEVCMGFALWPDFFNEDPRGRAISQSEARKKLQEAEAAGLVHMTANFKKGQFFVCNCCGCCCVVLKHVKRLNIPATQVINSHYYAVIDPELCSQCLHCQKERCQVNAIERRDGNVIINPQQCIGCGLCISTCPENALQLHRKKEVLIQEPPKNEYRWLQERSRQRCIDISNYM